MRSLLRLLPLLLCSLPACALAPRLPRAEAPLPVDPPLRKQVLEGYMPLGTIAWLNDRQLVFTGAPVAPRVTHQALYLWDLKGKPRLLLPRVDNACVADETIHATVSNETTGRASTILLRGPDFTPRPAQQRVLPRPSVFEPISCSSIATPTELIGRSWKPLRKGQGFLDFGPRDGPASRERSVQHLSADLLRRQDTGIRMEPPFLPQAKYFEYDKSYLIFDLNMSKERIKSWKKTGSLQIWRLNEKLQGSPLAIPHGEWTDQDIGFLLARDKIIITSNSFTKEGEPRRAGVYLLPRNGKFQRLERGLAENAAISMNGCSVSYSYKYRLDTSLAEGGPRLVVIHLCANQGTQTKST